MNVITDERCTEYSAPGHPERPARVSGAIGRLKTQDRIEIAWHKPLEVENEVLLRAHPESHLERVRAEEYFDGDTPAYPGIWDHARRSVGGALQALKLAREGKMAFSLLRPPGHHAMPERAMGFCYLSTIAIAVLEALNNKGCIAAERSGASNYTIG